MRDPQTTAEIILIYMLPLGNIIEPTVKDTVESRYNNYIYIHMEKETRELTDTEKLLPVLLNYIEICQFLKVYFFKKFSINIWI